MKNFKPQTKAALIFLRDSKLLELPVIEEDEETERDYRKPKRNPYDA